MQNHHCPHTDGFAIKIKNIKVNPDIFNGD